MRDTFEYAGFWRRFAASFIDIFLGFLSGLALMRLPFSTRLGYLTQTAFTAIALTAYTVILHAKWGQTIGKRLASIEVVSLNGTRISWRQSFLRSSVDIGFATMGFLITTVISFKITNEEFTNIHAVLKKMRELETKVWLDPLVTYLSAFWSLSELIVILFNEKRRAIHDYIAGTIVIHNLKAIEPIEQDWDEIEKRIKAGRKYSKLK